MKYVIELFLFPIFHRFLSNKEYLNEEDTEKYKLGLIYAKKNSSNFFKLCYYTLITLFGYYVLCDLPCFPRELLGKGELSNCFTGGYPDWMYHIKPELFNVYYLTALAFHLTDLIWLLWIYELQTDFKMMLVHHICTITLITFSYLCNYSNIGSIIIFLHDFGDIFVYIMRVFLNTKAPKILKTLTGFLLLIVWIYTRLYVLFGIIIEIYIGFSTHFNWANVNLLTFLCFLYVMHIIWVYHILKKLYTAIFVNRYEDCYKFQKVS